MDSSTGVISGIPAVADAVLPAGTVPLPQPLLPPLVFQVTDATGAVASATLPITVAAPVTVLAGAPPAGTVGTPYSFCLYAQGGDPASGWSWSVVGSAPPGTALASPTACPAISATQVITLSGTPTQSGTFSFTVQATDPDGRTAQQAESILISPSETAAPAPALTVGAGPLTFSATAGAAAPPPQTLAVSLSSGSLGFSASVTQGASWLSVTPLAGTTPATLIVSVNTAGLGAGSYPGTIQVYAPGASNTPQSTAVTLTVSPPQPSITRVENAASVSTGAVTGGTLVSIMGTSLGPSTGTSNVAGGDGSYGTSLEGVQVSFNGVPAPLTYVSSTQINAIVPFASAGGSSASVQVSYNQMASNSVSVPIAPASPALFSATATGSGQGAILNQNYSVNSPTNPAAPGSVVLLYGSGAGVFQPPLTDGALTGTNWSKVVLPVTAQVNGIDAQVDYAGSAPGLVAGVMQINVVIPPGTPSGNVPITVSIGGVSSQAGITVAVQ